MQTVGFNPAKLSQRVKCLLLLRLVPFVEPNYNLVELGRGRRARPTCTATRASGLPGVQRQGDRGDAVPQRRDHARGP